MLVARRGKYLARGVVTRVTPDRSILQAFNIATHPFKRAIVFKRKSKSDKPAKASKKPKKDKKSRQKPPKVKKPAVALKKQPSDIYTVMLIISFTAVAIGCVLLLMELSRYGSYPWWNAA